MIYFDPGITDCCRHESYLKIEDVVVQHSL